MRRYAARLLAAATAVLVVLDHASALKLPLYTSRSVGTVISAGGGGLARRGNIFGQAALTNSSDFSYYTNITLNGNAYSVLIDTGRSVRPYSGAKDAPPLEIPRVG
jgi:predicted aspartyl protease